MHASTLLCHLILFIRKLFPGAAAVASLNTNSPYQALPPSLEYALSQSAQTALASGMPTLSQRSGSADGLNSTNNFPHSVLCESIHGPANNIEDQSQSSCNTHPN
ncbi:hypothetical protein N7G274_008973 [Stereocaulon virgatum]|uniref:Uncharacterized protein n=1 Tax=Stereocaulon virgatum TaxID=373712 RepID=A0ABR3ZXC6_9LECA